jgi:hypothetical protein
VWPRGQAPHGQPHRRVQRRDGVVDFTGPASRRGEKKISIMLQSFFLHRHARVCFAVESWAALYAAYAVRRTRKRPGPVRSLVSSQMRIKARPLRWRKARSPAGREISDGGWRDRVARQRVPQRSASTMADISFERVVAVRIIWSRRAVFLMRAARDPIYTSVARAWPCHLDRRKTTRTEATMIRQVTAPRNGRGCRNGTVHSVDEKAQAEPPTLIESAAIMGLAPVPDGLVRDVFVCRFIFSSGTGTGSHPSGTLAPSGPHLVQTRSKQSRRPFSSARTGFGGCLLIYQ